MFKNVHNDSPIVLFDDLFFFMCTLTLCIYKEYSTNFYINNPLAKVTISVVLSAFPVPSMVS